MKTLQKIATTGLIALGIAGIVACCPSKNDLLNKNKDDDKEYIYLGVDDTKCHNIGCIRYDGMISDKIFAVSSLGHEAVNRYYSTSVKTFKVNGCEYDLVSVSPDSLKISYSDD